MTGLIKADLFKKVGLTDEEKEFLDDAGKMFHPTDTTTNRAKRNLSRIMSEMYLMKNLQRLSDDMIVSNETLSESNEKYAKRIAWLTLALVFVGAIQAGAIQAVIGVINAF